MKQKKRSSLPSRFEVGLLVEQQVLVGQEQLVLEQLKVSSTGRCTCVQKK